MKRLKQLIAETFRRHTVVRYLFVGSTSYVFELSSLLLIHHLTGSRVWATAISFWVGFTIAFVLQKLVAFQEYSKEMRVITKQTLLFCVLNGWNYIFTVGFVSLFPDKYLVVSRTVALVLMSAWNFVIYHKIIFRAVKTRP